ncbi:MULTISPECIES: SAM-dependent methyltransferase [Weeksella]|uniref:Methyltransferase type 11 n=1 Tax=Weeksella virosa (strain ATCC 43766 / DSM 16922 / JCM 21250 / CCUG 30538 / CDC 9751 / IAM 14551 / NBRC 16016 / NCTC 11634 / CL345/78) TaxID=865938 RepID=F0P1E8_WEEVC|nr:MULTISPECIES: class I SAM-dependent methyltransferase [Weeksella]ADX68662.1 Methyltransferase type 11 [Weeksella virosa DSM 16922]MDK7675801.1 methyltransferase domain-containing protein [Weeksella virosa]OFM85296.1 methyltransferase [Weeksella sp. HMSC059D05]SUP55008.1 Glycine/sarcosine N-methyltransferase [Weeksella virosa]VEH63669.1 Glycine/sarcosine N-methyltransferase [Weeksella virosa]
MPNVDKEWFATWFNTPYYHLLYNNRNTEEAEDFIRHLANYLQLPLSTKVMDLACGKGRHSVFLNKLGYEVTGLDLSENSIEYAKQFSNNRLHFDVHDMREVYKKNAFGLIVNLFTSFGYFLNNEDHLRVFQSVYDQLEKNGIFVLDYLNVEKAIHELIPYEKKEIQGISFDIHKQIKENFIQKDINFRIDNEPYHYQEFVKIIRLEDFVSIAKKVGFQLKAYFGDYQLNAFEPKTSSRLILIFEK